MKQVFKATGAKGSFYCRSVCPDLVSHGKSTQKSTDQVLVQDRILLGNVAVDLKCSAVVLKRGRLVDSPLSFGLDRAC